jgi:hypothetical protein
VKELRKGKCQKNKKKMSLFRERYEHYIVGTPGTGVGGFRFLSSKIDILCRSDIIDEEINI